MTREPNRSLVKRASSGQQYYIFVSAFDRQLVLWWNP